jgi:hypothetical protein
VALDGLGERVLYWLRQAGILLVMAIAVVAFDNVRDTPARLRVVYKELWRSDDVRKAWRTELAGEDMLSDKVQAMLALLRKNRVETFRYSAGIAANPDQSAVQRIAEAAYPIRLRDNAKDLLALAHEPLDPGCTEIDRKLEVVLARCS